MKQLGKALGYGLFSAVGGLLIVCVIGAFLLLLVQLLNLIFKIESISYVLAGFIILVVIHTLYYLFDHRTRRDFIKLRKRKVK